MYKTALLKHLKSKIVKKGHKVSIQESKIITVDVLKSMVHQFYRSIELELNIYLTLWARYVPSRLRSTKTNKLLSLADQSYEKIMRKFDIRNVLE
jgi:hypothetical protein